MNRLFLLLPLLFLMSCGSQPSEDPVKSSKDFFLLSASVPQGQAGEYCAWLTGDARQYLYNKLEINCLGPWVENKTPEMQLEASLVFEKKSKARVVLTTCYRSPGEDKYSIQNPLVINLQRKNEVWLVSELPSGKDLSPRESRVAQAATNLLAENSSC